MSPGGADRYADLEIRVVRGHNPDLVVTSDGDRRFDLTAYATVDDLHALVEAQGFVARDDTGLQNKHEKCFKWRSLGECVSNPSFMQENCALACHDLVDRNENCAAWAEKGQCESNPKFMHPECPVACGWKQEL